MEGSLQYCKQLKNFSRSSYQCCKQCHHFQCVGELWLHWLRHSCKDQPMEREQMSSILRERLCYTFGPTFLPHHSCLHLHHKCTSCFLLSLWVLPSLKSAWIPIFSAELSSDPHAEPMLPLKFCKSPWLCSLIDVYCTRLQLVIFLFQVQVVLKQG